MRLKVSGGNELSLTTVYLEEDKATETQNTSLHGAAEVSSPPEIRRRNDVGQSHQPPPHAVTPLHVEDELELVQSHVVIHAVKTVRSICM